MVGAMDPYWGLLHCASRVWLLYFIWSMSKAKKITVKLLEIKGQSHTFRNTTYSNATRLRLTMQYQ